MSKPVKDYYECPVCNEFKEGLVQASIAEGLEAVRLAILQENVTDHNRFRLIRDIIQGYKDLIHELD